MLTLPVSAETVQEILNRVDRQWTLGDESRAVELIADWLGTHTAVTDCLPLVEYLQRRRRDSLALEQLYRLEEVVARPGTEEAGLQGGRKLLLLRQRQLAAQDVCKRILRLECSQAWPEDFPAGWWRRLSGRLIRLEEPDRQTFIPELLRIMPVYWLQHAGFSEFRNNALAAGLSIANLEPFLEARLREVEDPDALRLAEQLLSPPVLSGLLVRAGHYPQALKYLGESPASIELRAEIFRQTGRIEELRRELPGWCEQLPDALAIRMLTDVIDPGATDEVNLRLAEALLKRNSLSLDARLVMTGFHAARRETDEAVNWLPLDLKPGLFPVNDRDFRRNHVRNRILQQIVRNGQVTEPLIRKILDSPRPDPGFAANAARSSDLIQLIRGLEQAGQENPELNQRLLKLLSGLPESFPFLFFGEAMALSVHPEPRRYTKEALLLAPMVISRAKSDPSPRQIVMQLTAAFGWKMTLDTLLKDPTTRRFILEQVPEFQARMDREAIDFLQKKLAGIDHSRKLLTERLAETDLWMQTGKGTAAIELLESEFRANPMLGERRWQLLGRYYQQTGNLRRGEEFFRSLAGERPWPALYGSASLAAAAGRNAQACEDLTRLRLAVASDHDRSRIYTETINGFHALLTGSERRSWLEAALADPGTGWEGILVIWMNERLLEGDTAVIERQLKTMDQRMNTSCRHLLLLIGPAKESAASQWLDAQLIELGQNRDWTRKVIRRRMELLEKSLAADLPGGVRTSLLQGQARRLITGTADSLPPLIELILFFQTRDRQFALNLGHQALKRNDRLDLLEPRLLQLDADFCRDLFRDSPAWLRCLTVWCRMMAREKRYPELRDEVLRVKEQVGIMSAIRLLLMNAGTSPEAVCLLEAAEETAALLHGPERAEVIARLVNYGRGVGLLQRVPLQPEAAWQGRQQLQPVWKTLLATDPEPARILLRTFRYRVNASERDELVKLLGDDFRMSGD